MFVVGTKDRGAGKRHKEVKNSKVALKKSRQDAYFPPASMPREPFAFGEWSTPADGRAMVGFDMICCKTLQNVAAVRKASETGPNHVDEKAHLCLSFSSDEMLW